MADGVTIKMDLQQIRRLQKKLNRMGKIGMKISRRAVAAGAKPVLGAAQSTIAGLGLQGSGLLKKSLGIKTKVYKKSQTVLSLVGSRRKFRGKKKVRQSFAAGTDHVPANIIHLVELGHRIAVRGQLKAMAGKKYRKVTRKGTHKGNVPPRPFLGPAASSSKSKYFSVVRQKMAKGIIKEATKGVKGK